MTTLCIKIYYYFRSHRAVFWAVLVILFAFLGFYASKIHLEEDLNKLMPASKNPDGTTKLAFADLKIKDKTFLLFQGRKGMSPDSIAAVCDDFVAGLERADRQRGRHNQVVGDVFCQIPEDGMTDALDYMTQHLPAYIDTSAYRAIDTLFTLQHMTEQMRRNYRDLNSDAGDMFYDQIASDPLGIRNVLKDQYAPLLAGSTGGYKTISGHFFVPDSTVCVAFITPRFSATNTGQGSALFEMLNKEIDQFSKTHPGVKISYHGTPASGYYNATTIKHDLLGTIIGSLILVLVVIGICFRNYDTIPLLLLPVAFGTLLGLACMYFIRGQFSLLALGIGAVVLGVAMSYVLHVLTHFKYVGDPVEVLRDEVKPVCLGCLTTIGSFLGLIFINTDLLKDFGLFATFAIAGTTIFSLVFLPQFLNPASNKVNKKMFAWVDRVSSYPFDRNKWLTGAIAIVVVVCVAAWAVKGTQFDADMHDLGYKAPSVTYSENVLRSKTHAGDKSKYFAASGKTMEEAITNFAVMSRQLDSLQAAGLVKSYTHTSLILVPLSQQRQRIDAWKRYWTPARQDKARSLIAATAPQAGLEASGFDSFFDLCNGDFEPDALYKSGLIPEGYLSTLMEKTYNGDYLCFTSVRCKNDSVRSANSDYIKICKAVADKPHQMVLDTYYYTTDALNKLNSDFNVLQWVSMAFVLLVLLVSFKFNVKYTLLGFMPIILSWLVTLGAMAIFGYKFNLINIIISTFIFGIGVDYSIFVMTGLVGSRQGRGKLLEYHKTAIFFSAFILVVTVGSMLLARHPAIKSVGFCTLVGLVSAVVISYVLQPAIFRWINRAKKK